MIFRSKVDYAVVDAEQRSRADPRTFFIPARSERDAIPIGDRAALRFEVLRPRRHGPDEVRMWVEVTARNEGRYVGRLVNESEFLSLKLGDEIAFGPEHVTALIEDWPLLDLEAGVSRRCHEQDVRPGFVYRVEPQDRDDSGWRLSVGDETDEEAAADGFSLWQAVSFVLDRWPELRVVLRTDPVNGYWDWDDTVGGYVPAQFD